MQIIRKTSVLAAVLVLSLALLAGCGVKNANADKTIKVAASPTPHAEILNSISDALEEDGWTFVDRRPVKRDKSQESSVVAFDIGSIFECFAVGLEDAVICKSAD